MNFTKDELSAIKWCFGLLAIFFGLYIVKNVFAEYFASPAILDSYFTTPTTPQKVKNESSGETLCRKLATEAFNVPFIKIRPDFLKNNVTGANLELDIYNEKLKLAIEYNGRQHYDYVPFFHKNYEHFQTQKYRDEIKKMLCKQNGIHLIEIRYDSTPAEIATIIKLEASRYQQPT
jgi:hypothetical protein